MKADPIDVVFLIFILAGVILIVMSFVHRRKGMWDFNNDYVEPWDWDSINPKVPRYRRAKPGGFKTPYDEMQFGIELIIVGLLGFVYNTFGLKVCMVSVMAVSVASLVFNSVRLRRPDDDDELRMRSIVNLILSGVALFFGALVFFLT